MSRDHLRPVLSLLFPAAVAVVLALAPAAFAQDSPKPGEPEIVERVIYVPYKELGAVLGTDQGVFLSYAEFQALWEKAHKKPDPGGVKLDADVLVVRGAYRGTVEAERARFTAQISVEVLVDGWVAVPLPFTNVTVTDASVDGTGGHIRNANGKYEVLLKGKGPRVITVGFLTGVKASGAARSFDFSFPPTAITTFEAVLPGANVDASLGAGYAQSVESDTAKGTTTLRAFLGASNAIEFTWRAREAVAADVPPLIVVQADHTVAIEERLVSLAARLQYKVRRAPADRFVVQLPDNYRVLDVRGSAVRRYDESLVDGKRRLTIVTNDPVTADLDVTLLMAWINADLSKGLAIPRVVAVNAERQEGFVAIQSDAGFGVKIGTRTDAGQVEVRDLPRVPAEEPFSRLGAPVLGLRYLKAEWSVSLDVQKLEPRVTASVQQRVSITDSEVLVTANVTYDIQKVGIFGVSWRIPEGFTVVDVRGVSDREPVDEATRTLRAEFAGRRIGAAQVTLELRAARGNAAALALPLVRCLNVNRETTLIGVAVPAHLVIRSEKLTGDIFAVDLARTAGPIQTAPPTTPATELQLAFEARDERATRDAAPGAQSASLVVSGRPSHVTAVAVTTMAITEDLITVTAQLQYTVQYRGLSKLAFSLPVDIAAQVGESQIKVDALKQIHKGDAVNGRVRYEVELQRERLGVIVLTVEYQKTTEKFVIGSPADEPAPELVVEEVFSETGFVVVRKTGPFVVSTKDPVAGAAQPVDPRELPETIEDRATADLAFRYQAHPIGVVLTLEKQEFVAVPDAFVRRASLLTLLGIDREATHTLRLTMQGNGRQTIELDLGAGAVILLSSVDGQTVQPASAGEGKFAFRLTTRRGPEEPFSVEVRYRTPAPAGAGPLGTVGSHELKPPAILGVSVDVMLWAVALPDGWTYTRFDTGFERVTPRETVGWSTDDLMGSIRNTGGVRPVSVIPGEFVAVGQHSELGAQKIYQFVRRGAAPEGQPGIVIGYWQDGALTGTKAFLVALLVVGVFVIPRFTAKGVPEPRISTPVASIVLIAAGATFVAATDSGWTHFWDAASKAGIIGLAVVTLLGIGKWGHAMRVRASIIPPHTVYLPPRETPPPAAPPAAGTTPPAPGSGKKEA